MFATEDSTELRSLKKPSVISFGMPVIAPATSESGTTVSIAESTCLITAVSISLWGLPMAAKITGNGTYCEMTKTSPTMVAT